MKSIERLRSDYEDIILDSFNVKVKNFFFEFIDSAPMMRLWTR